MPGSSDDPLASLLVLTKDKALRFMEEWLDTAAPGEAVQLLYSGDLPGFAHVKLELPIYWYYDFMSQIHRPVPPSSTVKGVYRQLTFNYDWLHVDYYTVVGPIPPCPL